MKNLTLIKQSAKEPQTIGGGTSRIYKSLLTIFTLLTLAVGQMWGGYNWVTLKGDLQGSVFNNWSGGYTWESDGGEGTGNFYMQKNAQFKFVIDNGWYGGYSDPTSMNTGDAGYKIGGSYNFKYTGENGIICFHYNQKTGGDKSPYVWLTRAKVYLKNSWGTGEWTWKESTDEENGCYYVDATYGASGVNYGTDNSTSWEYISCTPSPSSPGTRKCRYRLNTNTWDGSNTSPTLTITAFYTVTFNMKGHGSSVESQEILYGEKASSPSNPSETGYTFGGWYTDEDCTSAYNFNSTVSGDFTLYAKWTENKSSITISAGANGSITTPSPNGSPYSLGVATKQAIVATPAVGYYFTGWTCTGTAAVDNASSASTYAKTDGTSGSSGTITANFALAYAFIEGRFRIFDAATRSVATNVASSEGGWDESSTRIPLSFDATNNEYYLSTYATVSQLSQKYSSEYQYFYIKKSPSSTSVSTADIYRPSVNSDAGKIFTVSNAGSGNKKAVTKNPGTTHSFWFNDTETTGFVKLYFNETQIWYWFEQYLKYDGNGNTGGSAPAGQTYYDRNATPTVLTNSYTKSGYTFVKWNTAEAGGGTDKVAGNTITMDDNYTLYAQWSENSYTVTVTAGTGGSVASGSVMGHIDTKVTLPTATPDPGYYFTGWTTTTGSVNYTNQSSANAAQVNGLLATATVRANFAPKWSLAGGPDGGSNWALDAYKFTTYAENSQGHQEGTIELSLAANSTYWIKLYDIQNTAYNGLASGASTSDVYYDNGSDQWWAMTNASGNKNLYVHTGAAGTYSFYWDIEDNELFIIYPTSWYITTGQSDALGGSFTAVDNESRDVTGGKFVANNATVTFTAAKNTGYTFDGWYSEDTYTTKYTEGSNIAISGTENNILTLSSITADKEAYAKFTPKTYTVTLTRSGEGYNSGVASSGSVTATYNATAPAATMPTATNGWAFMGYYTSAGGTGTQIIAANGSWNNVDGYISDGKWVRDGNVELFAYFKKAEITNVALSPATTVEPNATVTATPTISPTPTGDTKICWKILRSNGNLLTDEGFSSAGGNAVSFTAPASSGSYKVACVLRTGTACDGGTVLDSVTTDFVVAGDHTVTIRYQDSDGRTLAASTTMTGRPLAWSSSFGPATITGYTFDHWVAGDGVTISTNGTSAIDGTTTTTSTIYIKASYDGNLTAVYTKKNMIYFNNTLGWEHVYVYFYSSDKYWTEGTGSNTGTGASTSWEYSGVKPHLRGFYGEMTQIEGTNIWYWDFNAGAAAIDPTYAYEIANAENIAFTKDDQHGYSYFYNTEAIRRGDFKHSLSMYVPETSGTTTRNETKYYNYGYWMNYPENTGYTLLIYNQTAKSGATKLYEIPYEFTADYTMPMALKVDLEANHTYGFEIKRADATYYSNTTTITANTTNLTISEDQTSYCGLTTTAAGDYTFNLYYSSSDYKMDVTYPVAVNDYRIVYTDLATWSGAAHTASWGHPSAPITKNSSATDVKRDTVSFYWSYGSSPAIKYQTCTATGTGTVTWSSGTSIDVSSYSSVLNKSGVYNFIFEQPAGGASISLVGVEPYSGNYYIRTDCAGSTKWSNYQTLDHQMTYSDYAAANSGFTHYFAHWVTGGTNVKFVIANDYSLCITDTLVQDYGTVVANIDANGFLASGSTNNASIRFMWDYTTNKISRAYISGSTNISDRFLVLEGDAKMFDENGDALSISGLNANEINLVDDENFVYERTIMVYPSARAKLTAKYNSNVQYFKGSEGAFAEGTTVELLGGTYSTETKYSMRIVYDFKTDRLVTAYIPSSDVTGSVSINADLMLIREHQGEGQQLTFANNSSSLNTVKTVYGVMRFNRWILNNRANPTDHAKDHSDTDDHITEYHPLLDAGSQKSIAERSLYWISFPFDVNLSDVFGFGTYGTHWILMQYNGAERARIGYWKDNEEGFWEYIWDRQGVTLKAGKGYVLALELDLMAANNSTFWSNGIQQVELFFPSTASAGTISQTTVNITVPSHECTIDRRTDKSVADWNKDRRIADSHWNIIGVPSYANYGTMLSNGSSTITWNSNPKTNNIPFLYEWNANDNTYTVQSGTTYAFKAMHAYYVQYAGTLRWTLASATPSSIVARRTYAEQPESIEMRLELQQNDKSIDRTFIKLNNDDETSTGFVFGEDMNKEFNADKANIYSFIEGYMPTAGNSLPMSDRTTVVPLGVKIVSNGEYTFAMPEGTHGIGATLVDNVEGVRTNLGLMDYTVTLPAGTYDNRFTLEISPIKTTPTGVENVQSDEVQSTKVRKVLIDRQMYIIRDGKVFDARGARIQ